MNGWTTAIVSYVIAIIISFFVAGVIQLMVAILAKFTKTEASENELDVAAESVSRDDSAIAAVIAIAKHQ